MNESPRRKPVIKHHLLLAGALLMLALSGCEMLGLAKKKESPVVPPPPIRKAEADSQGAVKPATARATKPNTGAAKAGKAPGEAKIVTADGSSAAGGAAKRRGSAAGEGAESGDEVGTGTAEEADPSEPSETDSLPGKIVQAENRQSDDNSDSDAAEDPGADVVSPIEVEGAGAHFKKGQVAALVNGVPIFAEDVLRALPDELVKQMGQIEQAVAAGQAAPEVLKKWRQQVVGHFLQQHIQQELLLQALKSKIKPEQLTGIQKQLDAQFDTEYLPKVLKDKGYASPVELELELQKQGSSIETIRTGFRNKQLAQQYLGSKALTHEGFDRPDILKYYQEHLDDYAITARAKWEQIELKFSKHGGIEGARKKAKEIIKRLEGGEVFAVVAKACSDGSTSSKGGLWSWTTQGSVKSTAIDKALFEQAVGEIGPPLETDDSIDIIRVVDRTDAGHQKFEEVQEDIKSHLKQAQFQRRVNELLKELTDKAAIENFTDKL